MSAGGEIKVKFSSEGANALANEVAKITAQIQKMSAAAEKSSSLQGLGGSGGSVSFSKDTWSELHRSLGGLEDETIRVRDAVLSLAQVMKNAGPNSSRANTAAIKAQTAAMKDLANTNAMLHEVLIGEAPLNVQIATTRKQVAVATQSAANASRVLAASSRTTATAWAAGANSVQGFSRGFGSVMKIASFASPQLMVVATGAQAVARSFSLMKSAAGFAGITAGITALVAAFVLLNAQVDHYKNALDEAQRSINDLINNAAQGARKRADDIIAARKANQEIANYKTSKEAEQGAKKFADQKAEAEIRKAELRKGLADLERLRKDFQGDLNNQSVLDRIAGKLASLAVPGATVEEQLKNALKDIEQKQKEITKELAEQNKIYNNSLKYMERANNAAAKLKEQEAEAAEAKRREQAEAAEAKRKEQELAKWRTLHQKGLTTKNAARAAWWEENHEYDRNRYLDTLSLKERVAVMQNTLREAVLKFEMQVESHLLSTEQIDDWFNTFKKRLSEFSAEREKLASQLANAAKIKLSEFAGFYADARSRVGGIMFRNQDVNRQSLSVRPLNEVAKISSNTTQMNNYLNKILSIMQSQGKQTSIYF